jgi:hypothetical protein
LKKKKRKVVWEEPSFINIVILHWNFIQTSPNIVRFNGFGRFTNLKRLRIKGKRGFNSNFLLFVFFFQNPKFSG